MNQFNPVSAVALLEKQRSERRTLILGDEDVRRVLSMADCLKLQVEALVAHSSNSTYAPERTLMKPAETNLKVGLMPAYVSSYQALGSKLLVSVPSNRQRDLPRSMSTLTLLDAETGFPLALMSSTYLTSFRTAVTAALAASMLAAKTSTSVGVYGSGSIARLFIQALVHATSLRDVVVYSPTPAHRNALVSAYVGLKGLRIRATADPAEPACSDVIMAATDGQGPAFDAAVLRKGATIISVASRVDKAEIPLDALPEAFIVVDDRANALREAGEFALQHQKSQMDIAAIHAELGELLLERRSGRKSDDERWIFKSIGFAAQDLVTARAVFIQALREGVGTSLRLIS